MNQTQTRRALAWLALVAATVAIFYFVDPTGVHWLPVCPMHALTGLNCPGCGTTRALHQLAHGHFVVALHCNPLAMLAMPALGAWWVWRKTPTMSTRLLVVLIASALVFGVLRNIPLWPFTLLAPG